MNWPETALRVPPHSEEAERGVLGSVLLCPECMDGIDLKTGDFYDRRHQALWHSLCEMRASNKGMDAITIGEWLKDRNELERIGGYDYLIALQDAVIVPAHSQHYAKTVAGKSKYRRNIEAMTEGIDASYKAEIAAEEIASNTISNLADVKPQDDLGIVEIGSQFLEECEEGNVGSFNWWCQEWTYKMGRMDSELMILHAPRSTGKTALMLQWMVEAHRAEARTPLASIEMLKKDLVPRFISNIGSVSTFTMRVRGHVTQEEMEKSRMALDEIKVLDFSIRDKGMSIDDIRAWAIAESRTGLDAVFIDNLLSINDGGVKYQSKTIMYDGFIRKFRDLRDILDVPVIVLAHPNAEGGIAWSKDVENFADIILLLHEVPLDGLKFAGRVVTHRPELEKHVIGRFQKNRQGISPMAHLDFIGRYQKFLHVEWEQ